MASGAGWPWLLLYRRSIKLLIIGGNIRFFYKRQNKLLSTRDISAAAPSCKRKNKLAHNKLHYRADFIRNIKSCSP
jgi:hypothetical protein